MVEDAGRAEILATVSEPPRELLEKIRLSAGNCSRRDLDQIYLGFGFELRHGGNHDVFKHPRYPWLRATVGRHRELAKGYFRTAVRLIDELMKLEEGGRQR